MSHPNTPPPTTRTTELDPLLYSDEEDGRERVLLVDVRARVHAIPVSQVREVVSIRKVTRVPGAPDVVRGLVNVRGMVVTVLDLATCLGMPPRDGSHAGAETSGAPVTRGDSAGSIVLLEHGGRLAGLAVESVRDVRALDDIAVVRGAVPAAGSAVDGVVQGLGSAGGEVVVLLDVVALLARHMISSEEMGR